MNAWSVRQYEEIKNGILTDIANLSKRLSAAEVKLKTATGKEKHTQEEEVRKLRRYLAEVNENLRRFEFRYTHNGRGLEECNEELPPEGEAKKRKKRTKFPKDIDFNSLVVINPKTGKPYPVYKLKALYRDGKLDLSKQ